MYLSHPSLAVSWFRTMVSGFVYVLQGLAIVCTFGWATPQWDFDYLFRCCKKDLKKKTRGDGG